MSKAEYAVGHYIGPENHPEKLPDSNHHFNIGVAHTLADHFSQITEPYVPDTNVSRTPHKGVRAKAAAVLFTATTLLSGPASPAEAGVVRSEVVPSLQHAADTGPDSLPFGYLDNVEHAGNMVKVSGWTIDRSAARPSGFTGPGMVDIWQTDGAKYLSTAHAWSDRPDVGNVYPNDGPYHGFDTQVGVEPGAHEICVYSINIDGAGTPKADGHQKLGCAYIYDTADQLAMFLLDQKFADEDLGVVHALVKCESTNNPRAKNGPYASFLQIDMAGHGDMFADYGVTYQEVTHGVLNFDGSPESIRMMNIYLSVGKRLYNGTSRSGTWPVCYPRALTLAK